MPKNKKKGHHGNGSSGGGGGGGGGLAVPLKLPAGGSHQNSEDEHETSVDNWSTASIFSEDGSMESSVGSQEVDEVSSQEVIEDQLKDCLDGLSHKSAQIRKTNLENLRKAFQNRYLNEFWLERRFTVLEALERCLKKGKGEEQALAASCIALLAVQLGDEISDHLESTLLTLLTLLTDNSASLKAREQCARTLAICHFIMNENEKQLCNVMKALSDIFKSSFPSGSGAPLNHSPDECSLHAHALEGWCLLLTVAPTHAFNELLDRYLDQLPGLLNCANVDLRIVAGVAIAIMYELARCSNEEFRRNDIDQLCQSLRQLATDSQKHRSKKDRRQQRSSFREILRFVEKDESPECTIKFGKEYLCLDNWTYKLRYDTFCDLLGSGVTTHLKENELLRDVFELGSPLPPGVKVEKVSKLERNMISKARGQVRSRQRDKRSVAASGF